MPSLTLAFTQACAFCAAWEVTVMRKFGFFALASLASAAMVILAAATAFADGWPVLR